MQVPQRITVSVCERLGEQGRAWLAGLPEQLQTVCSQTGVVPVGEPWSHGGMGVTLPVRGSFGDAALKLAVPDADTVREAATLQAFGGHPLPRLLAHGPGWLLTELLAGRRPELEELDVAALAQLVGDLPRRAPLAGAPTAAQWAARKLAGVQEPEREHVAALAAHLQASAPELGLAHGDLASKNLLWDGRTVRCVDPEGVTAEPSYDAGFLSALHHPRTWPELSGSLAERCGLSPVRVRAWAALVSRWCAASANPSFAGRYDLPQVRAELRRVADVL